jgi:C_GCAxxG_C_C family probable redox protein
MRITQFPDDFARVAGELASTYVAEYHGCAQATLASFMEILGVSDEAILATASCFSGGSERCQACGALSGGLILIGLKYGRRKLEDGVGPLEASMSLGGHLIDRFIEKYETTNCCELTGFDLRDPTQRQAFMNSKEAHESCKKRIIHVAQWIAEVISARDSNH